MFVRLLAACAALLLGLAPAQAGRVALVIGQNAYPGGNPETGGLPNLANPVPDAKSVVELFAGAGFEVLSCDGKEPGCFDLDREALLKALAQLKARAASADLALVYFAGHGVATDEGNIVTPIDAKVNCETGAITQGVLVEQLLQAAAPAKHKFLILDACRDNPIGDVCPGLQGKKLAFTRIEAGALQGLLLVTSTQFGQQAKDGSPGTHSPFAKALLASLKASPNVYFEQVMNEVARATYEDAQAHYGFLQIPGKVVGGAAPEDCLAGKECIGDARMAALAAENGQLASDAAGVRSLLADDERARGKPYTAEERRTRVAALQATLASIGKSSDPLRQEARRLIGEGNVAGGEAKLDEALDADEKAAAEQERLAQERRKAAAKSARDLAVLATGKDVLKALGYYRRATKLDPSDADLWTDYAHAAQEAGRTDEAKTAYEQGERAATASNSLHARYWALLGLGDITMDQGDLPAARNIYGQALEVAALAARADPNNAGPQRDLAASYDRAGEVAQALGNLPEALKSFRNRLGIANHLTKSAPNNAALQKDLSDSYDRVGDVLVAQENLPEALKSFQASLDIRDRLAKSAPNNTGWQRDLSLSYAGIGDAQVAQGDLGEALENFKRTCEIQDRLTKSDPNNTGWQRDLAVSYGRVGKVLMAQGNLSEALKFFRDSLEIDGRLAKADPNNASWQAGLAEIHGTLGQLYVRMGDREEARRMFERGRAIVAPFAEKSGHQVWIGYLKGFDKNLAALEASPSQEAQAQAVLGTGKDVPKTLGYYWRATRLNPSDAEVWNDYAQAALNAGQTDEAKTAYEQGERAAKASNRPRPHYRALLGLGDVTKNQGDLSAARKIYDQASEIAARADPNNAQWQWDLSVSYDRVGDVLVDQGNLPEALKSFQASLAIRDRLAKADPNNAGWQSDLSVSYIKVGKLLMAQGNLPEALKSFQDSLVIADRLAKADPNNAGWQTVLSVSYINVGGVLVAQGNLPEALKSLRGGLAIQERLAEADPSNAGWQRVLSVSYESVGDVLGAQGNLPEALKSFQGSLAIRDRLAKADPNNAGWQRDLSVSYNKVGDVLGAQRNLPEALKSFQGSLAIRDRLAKADPYNARWQYDLGIGNERIGDVQMAQGDLAGAMKSYEAKREIISRLAKADPNNAGWQRDLSVSYEKVGDVLVVQGNLPEALKSFQGSLAIAGRLAETDPNNEDWQKALAANYAKLANAYRRQGEMALAKYALTKGLEVIQRMTVLSPDNVEWKKDLAWFEQIAALDASPFQEAEAQAQAAFEAGQPSKAAVAQAKLAGAVEKAEREKAGRPGPRTASALLGLSWYRLFARDFKGALAASERAGGLSPDPIYATNRAHALMFLGRAREAKWLHQMYKGQPVQKGGKLWEEAIRDDFKEFGKRGLKHAQMAEIEALLAPAAPR